MIEYRPLTMWDDPWGDGSTGSDAEPDWGSGGAWGQGTPPPGWYWYFDPVNNQKVLRKVGFNYPDSNVDRTNSGAPYSGTGPLNEAPEGQAHVIPVTDAASGAGGGGASYGGGGGGGSFSSAYGDASSLSRFSFDPGKAPMFDAPTYERRADFVAPSWDEVLKDPGYQFRKDQGLDMLGNRYASIGTLNTGGAKKGFIDYNQNLASQEYGNVYNRAANTYGINVNQDLNAYDRLFQEKAAEYAPRLTEWQTLAQLGQRGAELNFNRDWDMFTFGSDDEFRRSGRLQDLLKYLSGLG